MAIIHAMINLPVSLLSCCLLLSRAYEVLANHGPQNPLHKIHMENALSFDSDSGLKARVIANITEVEGKQAWVEVYWSGFTKPSYDDWLGVITPPDVDIEQRTVIKYKRASESPSHLRTGRGSITFLLENHRSDVAIGFFYNGFKHPRLAGESQTIKFLNPDLPSHGRLTLTGDNTEMVVQWTSATDKPGFVLWGSEPDSLDKSTTSSTLSYGRDDMCGGKAKKSGWIDPGVFHRSVLTGLVPGQRYYYQFGNSEARSEVFSFAAAPVVGPETSVSVLLLADMGQAQIDRSVDHHEMAPSADTCTWMMRDAFEGPLGFDAYQLMAHFGDISYAEGWGGDWDRYHAQVEPLVTSMPYMVAIGNHERDWEGSGSFFNGEDSGGECGVPHERRFLMPSEEQDEPWFQFSFGPIHFIYYSTEHPFHRGSKQHDWVAKALGSVDRSATPWLIFGGHRPIYIDSTDASRDDGDLTVAGLLQHAFEDLLIEHEVDVTLNGHHHSYQRSCPLKHGKCVGFGDDGTANGPVHMVIGNAGAGLCLNIQEVQPAIWEKVHVWWGYQRLHANATHFQVDAVSNLDGEVFDSMTLVKPESWRREWLRRSKHRLAEMPAPFKRKQWWWERPEIGRPPQVARMSLENLERFAAEQLRIVGR